MLLAKQRRSADHIFAYLMLIQYGLAVSWALINFPRSYVGSGSSLHPWVWVTVIGGGLLSIPNVALTLLRTNRQKARWSIAISQMLMSCLLIGISGGRLETHFHIFGSLAFIALYRNWKLLIPSVLLVIGDHIVRGFFFPQSLYGVSSGAQWRFVEHAAWILFEAAVLVAACIKGTNELREIANQQAALEETQKQVESQVEDRTTQLKMSEERKSAILASAVDGIVIMDSEGKITECNPAAAEMFGIDAAEVRGQSFATVCLPEDYRARHLNHLRDYFRKGDAKGLVDRVELVAARGDSTPFPIEMSISPSTIDNDTVFTAYLRDISDRKKLEAELTHSQKIQTVGQLATGVAHEINTPNQYIADNLLFLRDNLEGVTESIAITKALVDELEAAGIASANAERARKHIDAADLDFVMEEMPRAIDQALEGVGRVAKIVSSMKTFSHPGQVSQTSVNVNQIIESTVEVARNEWKYTATIDMQLDPALPNLPGYPSELGQVFLNMIINAVHAMQEKFGGGAKGQLIIKTEVVGTEVVITIADNGAGIPQTARAHIFEAFFTTKDVGIGTGQGLAISRSVIVERHGGSIDFVSLEGKGTTFVIKLPIRGSIKEAA